MSEVKKEAPKEKPNLKYQRDRDREMVKGIFRFHEVPGGRMEFTTKFYKWDPVEKWDLVDGQVYNLPLGVAKHLNKNLWYPEYEFVAGDNSMKNAMRVQHKVRRCSFQSLEFVDIDDLTPSGTPLSQVEVVNPQY